MSELKPWKSLDEQLQLLKARGLIINNEQAALNYRVLWIVVRNCKPRGLCAIGIVQLLLDVLSGYGCRLTPTYMML